MISLIFIRHTPPFGAALTSPALRFVPSVFFHLFFSYAHALLEDFLFRYTPIYFARLFSRTTFSSSIAIAVDYATRMPPRFRFSYALFIFCFRFTLAVCLFISLLRHAESL